MAILNKGTTYAEGSSVTANNLNQHVDNAEFVAGAGNTTDDSTLEVHADGYLKIKDGGITSEKLASDAISGNDTIVINNNNFTSNSINGDKLVNSSVTSTQLANSAVTTNKIANGSITSNKFASGITITPSAHTHSNATTSNAGFMSNADKSKLDGIQAGATSSSFPSVTNKTYPAVGFDNDPTNITIFGGSETHWWQHGSVVYFYCYFQISSSSPFLQAGYSKSQGRTLGVRLAHDASMPKPQFFKTGCDVVQATAFNISGDPNYNSTTQYTLQAHVTPQIAGVGASANMTTQNIPQAGVAFTFYPINKAIGQAGYGNIYVSEFVAKSGDPILLTGNYWSGSQGV